MSMPIDRSGQSEYTPRSFNTTSTANSNRLCQCNISVEKDLSDQCPGCKGAIASGQARRVNGTLFRGLMVLPKVWRTPPASCRKFRSSIPGIRPKDVCCFRLGLSHSCLPWSLLSLSQASDFGPLGDRALSESDLICTMLTARGSPARHWYADGRAPPSHGVHVWSADGLLWLPSGEQLSVPILQDH